MSFTVPMGSSPRTTLGGVLAGLLPARRAAGMNVLDAITTSKYAHVAPACQHAGAAVRIADRPHGFRRDGRCGRGSTGVRFCAGTVRNGAGMAKPVLIAVSGDSKALDLIDRELTKRYEADYEVVCERSAYAAVAILQRLSLHKRQVAVVLADQQVSSNRGPAVLSRAGELHPGAKRILLIPWGDRSAAEAVRRGSALGQIDFWALKPWRSPDEEFLALVGESLREWSSAALPQLEIVRVVGQQWSARSHEVRDLLARNAVPFGF